MLTREFVLSFREAAPYINAYRGKTFVLAVSGETLQDGEFASLAQDINLLVSLGVRIVLVHGIRPQIEGLLKRHGIARLFHRDRRVTDAATMDVVKQAAGATRCDIEALLSMGMPNSPMHGAHLRVAGGNFVTAQPLGVLDGVDMQYTGQVRRADGAAIRARLDHGELVLLSPIGYSLTGEAFNLTMEELATHVAITLKAEKLIFVIEQRGVMLDEELISTLTAQQAEDLLASGRLQDDVSAYLPYAIRATREGIPRAHLISRHADGALLVEHFTRGGNGTMIARDPLVRVRNASIEDIGDIIGLIQPLEEQGVLVKRSREHLEVEIGEYSVLEHDGKIYGCVAMHPFPDAGTAELACLAVAQDKRDGGFGEMLLKHVEYQARTQGLQSLFVLTTQTAHWFVERGFAEADKSALPLARQQFYNYQRRSKVFVKVL
ncbi:MULTISPECIES: amino-acid N-acetyltransferase [Chromobacterium]|uniref:Amino-acid acetyltransferase n=2 Tax=Chromobacterium TaxID=535 RepID=A0ABS3GNX8_9NEIS|nr:MULTISPECIES: amino-acid N-acetyltransferase [Chromobacterium]AXT47713.1 amino-acid N-acetyltransferase [Chromobacterium rhizoryzae]MBK0415382.1 amino-acid N-acetyltransferase [Chromobacterium haemolyticum]MBO0416763.1 amino-acid N-acetyltransferase [Chromobacterium haemolyticum]MBO0500049.1 amino-acid N-acetyltransferase [Chromobacterium haemolyticum]MDH0341231.1 amino-acid N-acetyltransferase [Chromobacterium haemolyticum]